MLADAHVTQGWVLTRSVGGLPEVREPLDGAAQVVSVRVAVHRDGERHLLREHDDADARRVATCAHTETDTQSATRIPSCAFCAVFKDIGEGICELGGFFFQYERRIPCGQ